GDLLDHAALAGFAHAVRKLGDDDRALPAPQLLDVRATTDRDAAAPRAVGVANATPADNGAAGREVGALDVLGETLDVDVRVVDHGVDRIDDFAEVVRRNVRRHPDRDSRGAVDDHAHRVIEEAGANLLVELARLDAAGAQWFGRQVTHRSTPSSEATIFPSTREKCKAFFAD